MIEVEARANRDRLGRVMVRRLRDLDFTDPAAIADAVSEYEVHLDGRLLGRVEHRYGDRWARLVIRALELVDTDGARDAGSVP